MGSLVETESAESRSGEVFFDGAIPVTPLEPLLTERESAKAKPAQPHHHRSPDRRHIDVISRARMWMSKVDPSIQGQHGSNTAIRAIERVVRGFEIDSDDDAMFVLEEWNQRCKPPWSEKELLHKIRDGREKGDTERGELLRAEPNQTYVNGAGSSGSTIFDPDPRPIIQISTELHYNVDRSVFALRNDPLLFQRDGRLVHVTRVTREQSDKSPSVSADDGTVKHAMVEGSPQISETSVATLRERLTRHARYKKWNERLGDYKSSLPTDHIVSATHARGEWPGVRTLVGIVETPTLRPDGSVIQDAGYDPTTGYLYQPSEEFPRVPDCPSQGDATKALRDLLEIFVDFPYVKEKEDAHRSVPVAAILTLVARPAIQGATPAFVFDASTRGSGKTLQTDAIAMVVSGRPMPRMNYPHQEEELEKVLAAYALRGAQFFSLDNVTRPFGGGALDRVITARDTVDLRVLGRTEVPTLSWRAVVLATGNNMSIYQDTARRVLLARLEPGEADPERRKDFAHDDLPAWTKKERARLVVAALTVLRGYYVAGRPDKECDRWGSFEEWSRLIPQAIVWAGGTDPMLVRAGSDSEVDPEVATMEEVLSGLHLLFGEKEFRASEAIDEIAKSQGLDDLKDAIRDICETKRGHLVEPKTFGKRLSRYRGRIVGSFKLNGNPAKSGWVHWKVTRWRKDASRDEAEPFNQRSGTYDRTGELR